MESETWEAWQKLELFLLSSFEPFMRPLRTVINLIDLFPTHCCRPSFASVTVQCLSRVQPSSSINTRSTRTIEMNRENKTVQINHRSTGKNSLHLVPLHALTFPRRWVWKIPVVFLGCFALRGRIVWFIYYFGFVSFHLWNFFHIDHAGFVEIFRRDATWNLILTQSAIVCIIKLVISTKNTFKCLFLYRRVDGLHKTIMETITSSVRQERNLTEQFDQFIDDARVRRERNRPFKSKSLEHFHEETLSENRLSHII